MSQPVRMTSSQLSVDTVHSALQTITGSKEEVIMERSVTLPEKAVLPSSDRYLSVKPPAMGRTKSQHSQMAMSIADSTITAVTANSGSSYSTSDVEAQNQYLVPPKRQHVLIRNIRHKLWAVYQRLFTLVFLANIGVFIWYCYEHGTNTGIATLSIMAIPIAVNLFVSLLFRTEYWINFLYTLVIYVPHSLPLNIRRRLAKVYEFGGVHSGCGAATTLWALFFVVQITRAYVAGEPHLGVAHIVFTYLLVSLLVAIVVAAHPAIRRAQHNYFEAVHRFCGWAALALFWVLAMLLSQTGSLVKGETMAKTVFTSPIIYFLLAATFLTVLPWLRLRKVPCYAENLSDHAVRLYLPSPKMGFVEGVRISTNPLFEWHSFAAIPCNSTISPQLSQLPAAGAMSPNPKYSVLISKAGDWTTQNIQDKSSLRRYWIRGAPVRGVALVVRLFKRAVIVTTGSGIGPALSMLAGRSDVPCRLVWSTKDPLTTYGQTVLDEVRNADPDAVIWDTKKLGRPDMVDLTWRAYKDFGAEAVVCISNPKLTELVVYGMESRGVPAYGPVFDS